MRSSRGPVMICLLLGTHIFLTIRLRFIQRKLPTRNQDVGTKG